MDRINENFPEQLRRANLMFDAAGAESWKVGAAIFSAGATFAGVVITLVKVFGL